MVSTSLGYVVAGCTAQWTVRESPHNSGMKSSDS